MRRPPPVAAEPAAPLTQREFVALLDALGPFEPAPRLALAVSGGPDSIALAVLAAAWARARAGSVLGLIVDHGLRPESKADTVRAAAWLLRLGIGARVLVWTGAKPATGIQAAARVARMTLLLGACRSEAILHLLLAHQRDDQAETVALRRAAGSGGAGLAGMAAVREVAGLRLLRPLLAIPKSRLIATLTATRQPWLVDPANAAQQFARARLRANPAFTPDEPWAQSVEHATARCLQDERLAVSLARLARPHRLGLVRLDAGLWRALEPPLRAALLGRLLATVGGRTYPVAAATLSRAAGASFTLPATLGGCIIVRRGDDLLVCREPGRIRHHLTLAPGSAGEWDGRFSVRHELGPTAVVVRALGASGARLLGAEVRVHLRRAGVPATILYGLPAAWAGTALIDCPPLAPFGLCTDPGYSIKALLRPRLPLTTAPFMGVNVVSNPQRPIYRQATARVLTGEPASAVFSDKSPRPPSRRTQ